MIKQAMFRQTGQQQCQCSIFGNQRRKVLKQVQPQNTFKRPKRSLKKSSQSGRKSRGNMGSIDSQGAGRTGVVVRKVISLVPRPNNQENHYYSIGPQPRPQPRSTSPLMPVNSEYQLKGRMTCAPVITTKPNSYSVSTTATGSLLQQGHSLIRPYGHSEESEVQEQPLNALNQRPTETQSIYEDEESGQTEQSRVLISCKKIMSGNGGVLEKEDMIRLFDLKESSLPLQSFAKSHTFSGLKVSSTSSHHV